MGSYSRSVSEKMLANLTSLIWGSDNTPTTTTTTTAAVAAAPTVLPAGGDDDKDHHHTTFSIRASTPADEEEADWVLVETAEVGEQTSLGESHTTTTTTTTSTTTSTTTTTTTTPPSTPTPVAVGGGDWSDGCGWLVTPPPCFTRSQAAPTLPSSPLENLLIEHPSMSVYLPRPTASAHTTAGVGRVFPHRIMSHSTPSSPSLPPSVSPPSSQPATEDGSEEGDAPMREEEEVEEGSSRAVVVEGAAGSRTGGVAHRAAPTLLQAIDVLRPAQKAQRRREERRLKRTHLERSNKVREVAAAGNKPAKRRDMMLPGKFSRVVNNRKC